MSRETVMVVGAEELRLSEAVRCVGLAIGKKPLIIPAPIWSHYLLARIFELVMKVPLVARAQVRILAERVVEAAPFGNILPADLLP
jgi:NADH dehydrogenase